MASTFACSFLMYRAFEEPNSDVIARSMATANEAKKPLTSSQIRSNISMNQPQAAKRTPSQMHREPNRLRLSARRVQPPAALQLHSAVRPTYTMPLGRRLVGPKLPQ